MGTTAHDEGNRERADAFVAKVQRFVETLDDHERQLFAALIGPGVQLLWDTDEVAGFSSDAASWTPSSLRAGLAEAVQKRGLMIVTKD